MNFVAGFAAHFVLAQLLPQYLNNYDSLLADQLRGMNLDDARQGAALGEGLATSLLQERSAILRVFPSSHMKTPCWNRHLECLTIHLVVHFIRRGNILLGLGDTFSNVVSRLARVS